MKKMFESNVMKFRGAWVALIVVVAMLLGQQSAFADSYGTNITIWDKIGGASEDDETEPGTVTQQIWDLEGFFLNGNILSMVGGYDFKNGVSAVGMTFNSGDIFLDTNGVVNWADSTAAGVDPLPYGAPGETRLPHEHFKNTLGWEYAVRLNFGATNTYTIWALTSETYLLDGTDIATSNPWRVEDGQTLTVKGSGTFTYLTGRSDAQVGFSDWTASGDTNHNVITGIDLGGALGGGKTFISHFTMECGNDLLMGTGTTVPEPATLLLLGVGLLGVGVTAGRKKNS